jgi:hypothetical protein
MTLSVVDSSPTGDALAHVACSLPSAPLQRLPLVSR